MLPLIWGTVQGTSFEKPNDNSSHLFGSSNILKYTLSFGSEEAENTSRY